MCGLSKRIELRADEVVKGARCKRGVKMKVGWEVLNGNFVNINFIGEKRSFRFNSKSVSYSTQRLFMSGIMFFHLSLQHLGQQSENRSTSRKPTCCTLSTALPKAIYTRAMIWL